MNKIQLNRYNSEQLSTTSIFTSPSTSSPFITVIEDFLSHEEICSILKTYTDIKEETFPLPNQQGRVYPLSIYAYQYRFHNNNDVALERSFFYSSAQFNTNFASKFNIDIYAKLKAVLNAITNCPEYEYVPHYTHGGEFPFCTIRELFPGTGEMTVHCEKALFSFANTFYNNITPTMDIDYQWSFFVVLEAPESGGALTVFDFDNNEVVQKIDDEKFLMRDGSIFTIDPHSERAVQVMPKKGSLVIFNGGNYWHRIERIAGNNSRITLGGFVCHDNNSNKGYIWS